MNARNPPTQRLNDSTQGSTSAAPMHAPTQEARDLIKCAHRVLVHYLPGTPLPSELSKVRAMLDAHMFGRDKRTHRDDVVQIAREIDSWRIRKADELVG